VSKEILEWNGKMGNVMYPGILIWKFHKSVSGPSVRYNAVLGKLYGLNVVRIIGRNKSL